jgi:hypothetical protein
MQRAHDCSWRACMLQGSQCMHRTSNEVQWKRVQEHAWHLGVDAKAAVALQGLPAQLEHDSPVQ